MSRFIDAPRFADPDDYARFARNTAGSHPAMMKIRALYGELIEAACQAESKEARALIEDDLRNTVDRIEDELMGR